MRRSEITKELISLSKRAKELGFPQDEVWEGTWVWEGNELELITEDSEDRYLYPGEFLILTFSRCLEWLRGKDCHVWLMGIADNEGIYIDTYRGNNIVSTEAKTHHEAIAKTVCKILSEGQEVKILEGEQCK